MGRRTGPVYRATAVLGSLALAALLLAALLMAGCMSAPASEASGLDPVVQRWIKGVHDEDIELLMDTYWPEAELFMPEAEQGSRLLRGSAEIRRMQQSGFDLPMHFADLTFTVVDRKIRDATAEVRVHVGGEGFTNVNTLLFERRGGEWRIIRQVLEPLGS
jgi:ketosteroid isomerase-like protein